MTQRFRFVRASGCALALCFSVAIGASASPSAPAPTLMLSAGAGSSRDLAQGHWRAIAQGNVDALMTDYSPDAVFHWKEGAFEGDHIGAEAIRAVWIKFARARSPLALTVQNVQEARGSQGSRIVTAQVTFRNADWTYRLDYRLVFRDGKIVEETWELGEPANDPGFVAA